MVKTTITGADASPNGVWFEIDGGPEEKFVTRTALVRELDEVPEGVRARAVRADSRLRASKRVRASRQLPTR